MSRILLSLRDLDVFVALGRFLDSTEEGRSSLEELQKGLGRPASTISQAVKDLETYFAPKEKLKLIERDRRQGYGPMTAKGREVFELGLQLFQRCDELRGESRPANPVVFATTNAIRLNVLPGAVAAHFLRLKLDGVDPLPRIETHERDTDAMIKGVRDGTFSFGIGWAGGGPAYTGVTAENLVMKEIGIVAMIPDEVVFERLSPGSPLQALFRNHPDGIPYAALEDVLQKGKVRVAALKHDFVPEMSRLIPGLDPRMVIWVDHVEDVFACVRMCEADFGWAPEWYARRHHYQWRRIKEAPDKPLSKRIALFAREKWVDDNTRVPDLTPDAKALVETLSKFHVRFAEDLVQGDITPKAIVTWIDQEFGPRRKGSLKSRR